MGIRASDVQKLRASTGVGMMAAKQALEEAKGDVKKAEALLEKRGAAKAAQRSARTAGQGVVSSYVHANKKLAALVELRCETDFVARTPEFIELAHDLAMHVAATNPLFLSPEAVPEEVLERERDRIKEGLSAQGIPEKVRDKALEGKLEKYFEETCLLRQPFVKDPDTTVGDLVINASAKTGEKVVLERFVRFSI